MNQMTRDDFQALLRRLISAPGQPRDEAAWSQFCAMFEPTIRFNSRISGGKVPILQGVLDTVDLVDSVWRRCLEKDWVRSKCWGRSAQEVRKYFERAAQDRLSEKKRGQLALKRNASRNVSIGQDIDLLAAGQHGPDILASSNDLVEWSDSQLRAILKNDEEGYTLYKRILGGELTFASAARESEMLEVTIRRRFNGLCEKLRERFLQEFGGSDDDDTPS